MPRRARAGPLDGTVRAGTRLFGVFAGFQLSSAPIRAIAMLRARFRFNPGKS